MDTATIDYTSDYVPLNPQRVLDSRTGQGGLYSDSDSPVGRQLAPNTEYDFYYDNADIPEDEAAYAFNVTAIHPSGPGYLRLVSRCDDGSKSSLINYQPGKDIANFVVVPGGNCDYIGFFSVGAYVSLAVDLVGYYPNLEGRNIRSGTRSRIVDTRIGLGGGSGQVLANTTRSFQISGTPGVPVGARAVAINVTAINPKGGGHLRIYPDGAALPNSSSINYIPGVTKAGLVIVDLPPNGKIDVYSAGSAVDLAIDTYAYYPTDSTMVTSAPIRILDTRHGGTLAANSSRTIPVAGLAGVPADAQAVLMTVTSIATKGSTGAGNLRVFPAGQARPNVSTLNYLSATSNVANFTIVKLGTNGQVTLYSAGSAIDVAVDVVGYIPTSNSITPIGCESVHQGLRMLARTSVRLNC